MSLMSRFFGLDEGNEKVMHLAKILATLLPIVSATVTITTTFFMIFVAEALGGGSYIEGLGLVGILVVLQMLIQTLLDYPTGALGDWLGQRYILSCAFVAFAGSFYMVSLVTSSTQFWYVVLVYVLMGLGNSQMSGAFNAWFDNNYRAACPDDSDRKQYGVFMGKVGMLFQIVATASLIPGSILAAIYGRPFVFQIQAVLCIVIAVIIFKVVRDFSDVEEARQKPTMSEYTRLLKDGVSFVFSDNYVKYFIIGGTVMMSTMSVWGQLLLFPMYFSYLLTDVAVSSFRTVLFFPGIVTQERSGVWSRRFEPETWIPRFRLLQSCGFIFYLVFGTIMFVFPPPAAGAEMVSLIIPLLNIPFMEIPVGSILPVLLIMVTFIFTGLFGGFAEILTQRELIDVVPNRIRNSMYSLTPTIATIIAMPQIALFGWLLPIAGFPIVLISVGVISLVGALLIKKGLGYEKPLAKDYASDEEKETSLISQAVPEE